MSLRSKCVWLLLAVIYVTLAGSLAAPPRLLIASRQDSMMVHGRYMSIQLQMQMQTQTQSERPVAALTTSFAASSKKALNFVNTIWDFSRPHTIVGSGLSVLCLFAFATPSSVWMTRAFRSALLEALVPSLLMNLYITGLNQVTDVEIDKINKPYLPIASGSLAHNHGVFIVLASLVGAVALSFQAANPLKYTLLGSCLLGTMYSLAPFRLKRFPLLAAFCILVVRGSLVNLGFFFQAKQRVLGIHLGSSLWQMCAKFPESVAITLFFAIFGVVIALLKDVPDIEGDRTFAISSFSVQLGAARMFKTARHLLFGLLSSTAISIAALAVKGGSNAPTFFPRIGIAATLFTMAVQARSRALLVNTEEPKQVFAFYMHLWNVFYACYLLLPLFAFPR